MESVVWGPDATCRNYTSSGRQGNRKEAPHLIHPTRSRTRSVGLNRIGLSEPKVPLADSSGGQGKKRASDPHFRPLYEKPATGAQGATCGNCTLERVDNARREPPVSISTTLRRSLEREPSLQLAELHIRADGQGNRQVASRLHELHEENREQELMSSHLQNYTFERWIGQPARHSHPPNGDHLTMLNACGLML